MTRLVVKAWALVAACLVALPPGVCLAALSLGFGPREPGAPEFPVDGLGRHYFDLVFTETAPTEDEGLFAYDLDLRLIPPPGVAGGARLTGAERPPNNFVLDVPSGALFSVAESTADRLVVNVSSNEDLADINTGDKAARVFYEVDPGVDGRNYHIAFNPDGMVFLSADPDHELEIPVDLTDSARLPEPAGLSLLAAAGMLLLRRVRGEPAR